MTFNCRRELVPALSGDCTDCELCLRVCPALEAGEPLSPDELFGTPDAETNPHIGSFVEVLVGYSDRHRQKAASGGMTTWILEELFRKGRIDAAVCVARSEKSDRFFEPAVISSEDELAKCYGSKYYPVEFSTALAHITKNEGRYAVVALPCAVTAMRKAQRALPVLRERIRYVFGLVCGHGVSRQYADFLLAVVGLDRRNVRNMDFRYTGRSVTANNYAFRAQRTDGKWSRPLFLSGLSGRLWAGRFFALQACEFCDDLFSPLADATFMDAWLPEYVGDARGTSIVVVRKPELAELIREGQQKGKCHVGSVTTEEVLRSQAGALRYKTLDLPLRVARAERDGLRIPRSFERIPAPSGIRETLATAKRSAVRELGRRTFDESGRARPFWVSLLTAYLRAQCIWRAGRRGLYEIRQRIRRLKPR
jgi:coenzyme F420-reducing hydrogenase beta subunit